MRASLPGARLRAVGLVAAVLVAAPILFFGLRALPAAGEPAPGASHDASTCSAGQSPAPGMSGMPMASASDDLSVCSAPLTTPAPTPSLATQASPAPLSVRPSVASQAVRLTADIRLSPAMRVAARVDVRPAAARTRTRAAAHAWPLPVEGTITTRFSAGHQGIDIAASSGTPVRAIADGVVAWAGWKNNGGGNVVAIRHPNGMISIYNHNSAVTVRRGDQVTAGETISRVGSTGWATGPHLDFRVWMGGRYVDPLTLY